MKFFPSFVPWKRAAQAHSRCGEELQKENTKMSQEADKETQLHPNNPLTRVTKQSHMLLVSIQRPGELLHTKERRERWTWQHHQDVKLCSAEAG